MNNVNMASMNAMGGPVGGGGMPMMNNGIPGANRQVPGNENQQRSQLNTYIYEYFLRYEMYDCARAIINSDQPINVHKNSSARHRDAARNLVDNGVSPEGTDIDSKDDLDSKRPNDLPAPNLPKESPESCFLYEWWCLFWEMFNAQRNKGENRNVMQYMSHTQQNSRSRQEQQQAMLRQIHPPGMMSGQYQLLRNQPNGMNMGSNDIARKAMHNNRNVTPQHYHMLQQQQQHQKQQQMQRDGSDLDGSRRPQSPGSAAENAPSPSKRPRLDGVPFNGPQGIIPNGRQPQGIPGPQGPAANNALQASQLLLTNGMNPNNMTPQQFQQFQNSSQAGQTKALQNYNTHLAQHQQNQMPNNKGMPNPSVPQGQNSPMMAQGQDNGQLAAYYSAGEMGANGMRPGTGGQSGSTGNHALQDYQMQLMLLEQQNKKRLIIARQEQDNMGGIPRDGPGGPGVPGSNGQPFQGHSPQGSRAATSPTLNDIKRGTPQMAAAGIASPLPEGQSRGSPNAMNFIPGQLDPNLGNQFYKQMGGMDGSIVAGIPNGMRPPSSNPGNFNGQMNQHQMMNMATRQHQQPQQGGVGQVQGWQTGPNGTPVLPQTSQVPVPQSMGTPQQRAMPPPSAPPAGAPANGRTQPSSPQQTPAPPTPSQVNKSKPKSKKDSKPKRTTKVPTTTGATPAAAAGDEPATPTPATPSTPIHPSSFKNGQIGGGQNPPNGQQATSAAIAVPSIPLPPDPNQSAYMDAGEMFNLSMDFANPTMGNADVLQDFDFDSFLHQDGGEQDGFGFDASAFMEGGEVGAD